MKVLIVGSTGFIGTEILTQALTHPYITTVTILTRRPHPLTLTTPPHPKLTQILHEDFETYPSNLLTTLSDLQIDTVIWALGGKTSSFPSIDEARRVGVVYPVTAAEAFARDLAPKLKPWEGYPVRKSGEKGRFPFRFVYVSGWGAERDPFRRLWVFGDTRKIKGAAEKGLEEVAGGSVEVEGRKCFEVVALRPGGVLAKGDGLVTLATEAVVPSVTVDRLAAMAIKVALYGAEDGKTVVENAEILGDDWAMGNSLS